jgi:exosortase A-associated hydrolase 2
MNKARRMAALQARAMAKANFDVLQIDLLGCGDSSGDFSDATWQAWRQDVRAAVQWLRTQSQAPLTLWGLRAGCLLAASAAVDLPERANFLFWQPVLSGKQHWQQFLRLKMASELASGKAKGATEALRQQLALGQSVEIAGYTVAPALANGLQEAELILGANQGGRIGWFELSKQETPTLILASQKRIEQLRVTGYQVEARIVRGPSFWQTTEIEDAAELIASTLSVLESWQ